MEGVLDLAFLGYFKILIAAILIYAIIYSLLQKINFLSDKKEINALIALLTAIIVSFSGVVTYAITYAINWFVIILFIVFLLMVLLMFFGVSESKITDKVMDKKVMKGILIAFGVLFFIIFIKSFFALNNTFDTSTPPEDQYAIDTTYNTGLDDVFEEENTGGFWGFINGIDSDVWSSAIFLLVIGVFVFLMGR